MSYEKGACNDRRSAQHSSEQAVTTSTFTEVTPGSSNIAICVRNLSPWPITIPARITIWSVSAANIIPPMLASKTKLVLENQKEKTDANKAKLSKKN